MRQETNTRVSRAERCRRCGYTKRHHCDLDEPGLDHDANCGKVHHEFTVPSLHAETEKEKEK